MRYTTNINNTIGINGIPVLKCSYLSNVLSTVSDKKVPVDVGSNGTIDYFSPLILSSQDYYAFGSLMPGRQFNVTSYPAGFGGKRMDSEVKGTGNSYDFDARIYDPRIGGFLSLDPLQVKYPFISPYRAFNNNPIIYVDPTGKGGELAITAPGQATLTMRVVIYSDIVNDIQLQEMKLAAQEYIKENMKKEFYIKTKEGSEPGSYEGSVKVKLNITIEVKSYEDAKKEASENKSVANNYMYVGEIGDEGGHQEGNAGFLSPCATAKTTLHEIISTLGIYEGTKKGEFSTLHEHNEANKNSILSPTPTDKATLAPEDIGALSNKGIVSPVGGKPTAIGKKTDQIYNKDSKSITDRKDGKDNVN